MSSSECEAQPSTVSGVCETTSRIEFSFVLMSVFIQRIILRWIFRKWEGVVGTGWSGLRIGTDGGHL
jgi:hypothetical protein